MRILIFAFLCLFFIGCTKNIAQPTIYTPIMKVQLSEPINGYYENKIGTKKEFYIEPNSEDLYHLKKWPKDFYKSICLLNKICLIDTQNNGYFSHSAIQGREELYPLNKPSKYIIISKNFEINFIDLPMEYHNQDIKERIQIIYIPTLNQISKKEIGESIFEKIKQAIFDTYTITVNETISVAPKDEYGRERAEYNIKFNGYYKLLEWPEKKYKTICEEEFCIIDKNNDGLFSHYALQNESHLYSLDKKIPYIPIQDTYYTEDSFKYQALYQGKVDNKIKISFREFKNDMARPAFTQDIEYEVNSNKPTIIGFKGLRINVIKATNLDITYSVIQDYK